MENQTFKQKLKVVFRSIIDSDGDGTADILQLSKAWKRFHTFMCIVVDTFTGFARNRQGFQAVALSYFGLLAFVPLLAFMFAVTGGLGLADESQWHALLANISMLSDKPEMVDWIINFAVTIVDQAQSGGVGLVSALLFMWTIIWLFFQVERVFNFVWKTTNKRDRNIWVRFGWFLCMLVLSPFIVILFSASILLYTNAFKFMNLDLGALNMFVPWLSIGVIATFTFSLMFKFIPEVRIKYKFALLAGFVTAIVFTLFQLIYLQTQMFVSRMNTVYGVMAAVPLFLIWMNFSWQIILYGANLCKALQDNRLGEEYAFSETPKKRRKRIVKAWGKRNKMIEGQNNQ